MIRNYSIYKFLKALENIEYGSLELVLPDKNHHFEGKLPGPKARFIIYDTKVISNILLKGDVGLAESYQDDLWASDDLSSLLTLAMLNEKALCPFIRGMKVSHFLARFLYLLRSNTLNGSKRNIYKHYDLGNDFYSIWLDDTMTYSSAIFNNDNDQSLVDAQFRKYDRILERLPTQSGNLLEIGCGWGGFAERALEKGNFDIKGITISEAQHNFAKKRLKSDVNIALEDYRHQNGSYDSIVSIEMFEAVGEKYWPTYFSKMKSLLNPKGKAIIQTISIDDQHFERYRKSGDSIRTYIFPGGMLPSLTRFKEEAQNSCLCVVDHFSFGQDYAHTIKHWLDSFEKNLSAIRKLGFDDNFIRLWRFYLASCIASFTVGRTNVLQLEVAHA